MDYYEIDFLPVGTTSSGDAIALRYRLGGKVAIHVVDGGYKVNGQSVVDHVKTLYGVSHVDHVVATHPDQDHASGLTTVLEQLAVGKLWMNRPWAYADQLLQRFPRFGNVERLARRLRELYPYLAQLEALALERHIPIGSAFQGDRIGSYTVMAPQRDTFLDLVVASERTPNAKAEDVASRGTGSLRAFLGEAVSLVRSQWGSESFSSEDTSAENAMSIVQYAEIAGRRILLTGDVGRAGLEEMIEYAPAVGLVLPGINCLQAPHHGSRRNVSTELLDRLLGSRFHTKPSQANFECVVSAGINDESHPRRAVVRAIIHRGGHVFTSKSGAICLNGGNVPPRLGWGPISPVTYPTDQES